ncbi:hypothetical protein CDEF62S_03460 [Castellaniella defragrans]
MHSPLSDGSHLTSNVRQGLDEVKTDIEDILHRLGDAADEHTEELRKKVSGTLNRLRDIQDRTQETLHTANHQTQQFVREKPWTVIATTAVAAYIVGFLTRPRH